MNVTEVVRAVTGLHGISAQVREQIDTSLEATGALADSAARLEHKLGSGNDEQNPVIDIGEHQDQTQDAKSAQNTADEGPSRHLKLWT